MIFGLFVVLVVLFVVLPLVGLALWALVSAALVGLVIGALGRLVAPGSHPIGVLGTIFAGLVGSILGGFLGHVIHVGHWATVLLEIGVAAATVVVMEVRNRRALSGTTTDQLKQGW